MTKRHAIGDTAMPEGPEALPMTIPPTRMTPAGVAEATAARAAEVGAGVIVPKRMTTVQPIRRMDVAAGAETAGLPPGATRSGSP